MDNKLDTLFTQLGTGKWNLLHYITIAYAVGLPSPHALAGPFVAPRVDHKCILPSDTDDVIYFVNGTDVCHFYAKTRDGHLEEKKCTNWDFSNSTFTDTITSEFQLVCDMDYLRATYQSMYMVGVLVGSPINGIIADRFGRKTAFLGGCLLFMVISNISCWLPNLPSLLSFRFLVGFLHTFILKTGFIMAVEIADPKVRSVVGVTLFVSWGLGTMAWGGLAYLLRSWRYLLMAASLPSLLMLPALWFLDESPRWLQVRGQHKKALKILEKAAKWNNIYLHLPPEEEMTKEIKEDSTSVTDMEASNDVKHKSFIRNCARNAIILFRTPRLRLASIVMHLDFFVLGMVYFGLSLSGGNFNFNMFFYMALMGLMELPAYTVLSPIISRFGRKMPIAIFYLTAGGILLALPFLPSRSEWMLVSFALMGKLAISLAFQGNNLFATEVFPTEVRTRGVSSSFMMSRIGSSLSPFINEYLGLMYPWAPSVVFGTASAVAGLATLMLWETMGVALPDTISQLESCSFKHTKRGVSSSECEERPPEANATV